MLRILSVLLVVIFAAACDQSPKSSSTHAQVEARGEQKKSPEIQAITVRDLKGDAISGATVLIGSAIGDPFAGNFLTTDESGLAEVPTEWLSAAPVTVQAPGYISVTYQNQMPLAQIYTLRPVQSQQQQSYRVAGKLKGFGKLSRDGKVDFGMVVPALTRRDLFQLDATRFLSREMETIKIIGQEIEIPGNLVLPTQSERYGLIPINLDKNNYSIHFGEGGLQTATALHGRFDVSDVMKKVTSKAPTYELIKDFKLLGGSVLDLEISEPDTSIGLSVDQLRFESALKFQAPIVSQDEIIVAVSIVEKDGVILPTGFTALESGENGRLPSSTKLGAASLVTVRKSKVDFEQDPPSSRDQDLLFTLSATVLPAGEASLTPQNLELVDLPELIEPTSLKLTPPAPIPGVYSSATYATLFLIEEIGKGAGAVEKKTALWESYTKGWTSEVKLPASAADFIEAGRAYRWEVSFIGQPAGSKANLGPQILEQATHVSLSAKSF